MQQIYRRTPMPKFDFNKAVQHFGIGALLKIAAYNQNTFS